MIIRKSKTILTLLLAATLSVSHCFSFIASAASDEIVINIKLIESIKYTSIDDPATEEELADAILSLKLITQTAYDAFVMDYPMQSMWMDINHSLINVAPKGTRTGNHYTWVITEMKNTIKTLDAYSSPYSPFYLTEMLTAVVNSFTPDGETLYDRVKSIHDYICDLTVYTDPSKAPYAFSAYGALVDHRSVCEGYAEAFKLLCDRNGIECILVSGQGITSTQTENHMWNYVKMEDGKWYAVDVTWDDGKNISSHYLLVGSNTIVNSNNGTVFSENHVPSGDISSTNLKIFDLPTLSSRSYLENREHDTDTNTDETFPMSSEINTDSCGDNTDSSGSEDTGEISTVSTESNAYRYHAFSLLPSYDTPDVNDAINYYYNQLNDEQKNFYHALLNIVPPGSTEIPDTTVTTEITKPIITEPDTTITTDIKTDPPIITTVTTEEDTLTSEKNDDFSTEGNTSCNIDPPTVITEEDPRISDSITITIVGRPGEDTGTSPLVPPGNSLNFSDILRIIIIVSALAALFGFITILILKFAHNEKK